MTVIDSVVTQLELPYNENPYANQGNYLSELSYAILNDNSTNFFNATTNPEMGANQSVHFVSGLDRRADLARALEGNVFATDWHQDPNETRDDMSAFEANSDFFIMLEDTTDGPKAVGSLRVAVVRTPSESSETKQFFEATFPGQELPDDLNLQGTEELLWDVVSVVTDREHRDGKASNWLYHALYKKSKDLGVPHWISNIHDQEFNNLASLGIPFKQVAGTEKVLVPLGAKCKKFGFYTLQVAEIRSAMEENIKRLEAVDSGDAMAGLCAALAYMSRIAINGSTRQ